MSNKKLHYEAFNIDKNPRSDGCQGGLVSMIYKSFVKKALGRTVRNEIISNKELAEELHKPIIRRFNKKKSKITFYRQYLACRSGRYAIDKKI